jgi:hypothetical protein
MRHNAVSAAVLPTPFGPMRNVMGSRSIVVGAGPNDWKLLTVTRTNFMASPAKPSSGTS